MSTADRTNPASSLRTAVAWDAVRSALDGLAKETGRDTFDVVDLGGGTGGFAVALARLGHRVTVVDPSPDALAALERRVAEAGVGGAVRAAQGDLSTAFDVVDPESADAVLCHGVLEFADDPAEGCRTAARLLRPGGLASVLAANRPAIVLARALSGHVAEALAALRDPAGRFGAHDPVPRRFAETELRGLLESAGLAVLAVHGVRIFADLVPGAGAADPAPGAATVRELLELESAACARPEFLPMATQLHVLATRDAARPV
ncbi:MAG TPA: methyltransferase domain-containing protein [Actinocrinis sp.]|uniref:methyltransferase domain-containing protein n=1 Tax=Actinocrinis sp. TaxID=1920516 RepID=UPI002DDCDF9B|nr:methyltransferase domain-containing protein [Actinocrinis sp.]HEV3169912.1 methyltransferase domain-containing protein [Actinocrinis sp.]